ncbi:omega-amidase [Malassezia sp. CBS 17886]|nr:omega-amidase [Malassezia sp. CBS 17886]
MSAAPSYRLEPTRIALVQLGQTSEEKKKNLEHARALVLRAVSEAPDGGVDMVVLPECFNSPYGVQSFPTYAESLPGLYDAVKREDGVAAAGGDRVWPIDNLGGTRPVVLTHAVLQQSESVRMLSELAKEAGIVLVGGSIPERDDATSALFNTCCVFDAEGRVVAMHRKIHLFDINFPGKMTFQESETLTGGDRLTVFDCALGRFGLGICYDMRFPEIAMIAARVGAGAMIYPGAFNTTTGPLAWELLLRARAVDNQMYTIGCSPARPDEGYPAWGHSTVVDPVAQVVCTADEKETILWTKLDPARVDEIRSFVPVSKQRRFDVYPDVAR